MSEEKLSINDVLNVTSSVLNTMLDFADNSHKEIEILKKENKILKEKLNELKEDNNA